MKLLTRLYPDELIYSGIAREACHYGHVSPKGLLASVYGHRSVLAVPDLPGSLGALAQSVNKVWECTPESLAIDHTLVGYYTHHLGREKRMEVVQQMLTSGGNLQVRLGVCAGSAIQPRAFRICLQCHQDDCRKYGEPFWHRAHHLPGVLVCNRHGEVLHETDVAYRPTGRHEHVAAPIDLSSTRLRPLVGHLSRPEVASEVAKRSVRLLEGDARDEASLPDYRAVLRLCGFVGGRGGAAYLRAAFRACFGSDLLEASLRTTGKDCLQWLDEVLRAPRRSMHPYRHVLMDAFLWSRFDIRPEVVAVPYPNKSSRWGISRNPALRREAAAMRLHGYSTHAIARALDVDWKTSERLSVPLMDVATQEKQDVAVLKAQWQALADDNPTRSKKMLRLLAPALYAKLYRRDREWLLAWRSVATRAPVASRRVDWAARDASVAELIRMQVSLTRRKTPLRRVSRHYVLGELGIRTMLAMSEDLLPRSVQALNELCESVEDYQVRRLALVMARREAEKDWMVLREAGVNPARFPDGALSLLEKAGERAAGARGAA